MPTTREEKSAKPRARNRKADRRSSKGGQKQVDARAEVESARAMLEEPEVVETEVADVEAVAAFDVAPDVAMEPAVAAEPVVAAERVEEAALVGEVLPPEVLKPASHADGLQAIAQAYGEYTKKSWLNGRFLVERLIAVRSFDEAIEVQGEFAKQACSNFLTQSERICVLYGEWAQQFFRPLEKLATGWPRN
jgi:hypothetical protein